MIPNIDLETTAEVDGIEDEEFQQIAEKTKKTCPVSQVFERRGNQSRREIEKNFGGLVYKTNKKKDGAKTVLFV